MTKVSIVIPTYNRPTYLRGALESIKSQTHKDYEIIIVSNGESEQNKTLTDKLAVEFNAIYCALSEGNVCKARNYGIQKASGEWIAFLDDDDLWLPRKLELQLKAAKDHNADMVACDYLKFKEIDNSYSLTYENYNSNLYDVWGIKKLIAHGFWWAPPSAVMVKKNVIIDCGSFDPSFRMDEDNDLWRRISYKHKIQDMKDILLWYRVGHDQVTKDRLMSDLYGLKHFVKMWDDTPKELKHILPHARIRVYPDYFMMMVRLPRSIMKVIMWIKPRQRYLVLVCFLHKLFRKLKYN